MKLLVVLATIALLPLALLSILVLIKLVAKFIYAICEIVGEIHELTGKADNRKKTAKVKKEK